MYRLVHGLRADNERLAAQEPYEPRDVVEVKITIAVRVAVRVGWDAVLLLVVDRESET